MSFSEINSTAELISIALAGEREAIRRYSELAARMHEFGNDEAGALFDGMIDEERTQENQLTEWADLAGLTINTDIEPIRWEDPFVTTTYDAQAVDPNQSTRYKALAFAAHNKERAFRFYSYVAATCKDPDVRAYAEMLAHEKLAHTAILRTRRRRAWHAQRNQYEIEPRIDPGVIESIPELLAATVCIEQILVDLMDTASSESLNLQIQTASAQDFISTSNKTLLEGPAASVEVTAALKLIKSWYAQKSATPDDGSTALQRLCTGCDRSFKFYDSVVTSTQDEAVLLMAQSLSLHAMERILALRQLNGGSCEKISDNAGK
jgi:rubrerythrin